MAPAQREERARLLGAQRRAGLLVTVLDQRGAGRQRRIGGGEQSFGIVPIGGDEVQAAHADSFHIVDCNRRRGMRCPGASAYDCASV